MIEFAKMGNEPDIGAAVALMNEVAERGAFLQVLRYVADNYETQSVGDELLNYLTCNACSEAEEVVVEAPSRDHDHVGVMLCRYGDRVHRIAVISERGPIGHQFHYANTVQVIISSNHSSIIRENSGAE